MGHDCEMIKWMMTLCSISRTNISGHRTRIAYGSVFAQSAIEKFCKEAKVAEVTEVTEVTKVTKVTKVAGWC